MKKKMLFMIVSVLATILCLVSLLPNNVVLAENSEDFDVKSYCLMDAKTGILLKEKNSEEKHEVASMVKLMTSLLTMEKIERGEWSLDTRLAVSDYAASMEGSQAFLDAGKSYTIDNLLKSVIVASANDSSVVLAENYSGSEALFVDVMNSKAKELGMVNTLYANSTGLPAFNQYSTAHDIAKLLKVVSKHELYHKYSSIWMDNLVHESGRVTELVNTNRLVKYYPGCVCGKTGFTDEAGYCLSVEAKRNDMDIISVVMGAKTSNERFSISSSLLNFGFANFKSVKVVDSTNILKTDKKIKGTRNFVECHSKEDLFMTLEHGNTEGKYQIETQFNDIKTPVKTGDVVGKVVVMCDGKEVCSTELVSSADYFTPTYFDVVHSVFDNWSLCVKWWQNLSVEP